MRQGIAGYSDSPLVNIFLVKEKVLRLKRVP